MATKRSADLFFSFALIAVAIAELVASAQIGAMAGAALHPRTIPEVNGIILLATGVLLGGRTWRRGSREPVDWPAPAGAVRLLVTLVSLVLFLLICEPVGFPLATLGLIGFLVWYLGDQGWATALAVGAVSAAVIYFVFIRTLAVSLPLGLLE